MWWSSLLGWLVFLSASVAWWLSRRRPVRLPPGPAGLPLLGYLPFLGKVAYRKLYALSEIYGPVYSLYLGCRLVVVLNSIEAVQEALSNPQVMDRPPHPPNHLMPDSTSLSVSNGSAWKVQRNFAVQTLRKWGKGAVEERIQAEIASLEKEIDRAGGRPLDLNRLLVPSISNVVLSFLTSLEDREGRRRSLIDSSLRCMTLYFRPTRLHAYFPGLRRWMARLRLWGYDKLEETMEALSRLIQSEIDLHRKTFEADSLRDYIDEFLAAQGRGKDDTFTDSMLRGNFQSLLGAGSTPSRATLEWCLVCVAARPEVQERVFREVEGAAPITWSGRSATPYTLAVMMEAMRHHTVIPISMLRTNSMDCRIGGFDVPRGTIVMTNIWGVHHDPRHWTSPHHFRPERFLVDGQPVKPPAFIPFSHGKRNCPGEDVAWLQVYLFFASLVQKYRILPHEGGVTPLLGIANMAVPHSIRLVRR